VSTQNYNATVGTPLTRATTAGQAIANGANFDQDIMCVGDSSLIVEVDMTGGASGDVVLTVLPFEADNATVMPITLPPVSSVGPTLNGGHVYYYAQFDVTGLEKVRVRLNNANVAPQTITRMNWRLA
jgi:hypothetical protein